MCEDVVVEQHQEIDMNMKTTKFRHASTWVFATAVWLVLLALCWPNIQTYREFGSLSPYYGPYKGIKEVAETRPKDGGEQYIELGRDLVVGFLGAASGGSQVTFWDSSGIPLSSVRIWVSQSLGASNRLLVDAMPKRAWSFKGEWRVTFSCYGVGEDGAHTNCYGGVLAVSKQGDINCFYLTP